MRGLLAALLVWIPAGGAVAQGDPWVAMTRRDLQAVHDLLRDNHPGPVDPENPRYGRWLEEGLSQAQRRADAARSLRDYERALRFYTNGFQDGHIGVGLNVHPEEIAWPGFVLGEGAGGEARVIRAEADAGVREGDVLQSCDGRTLGELMEERVDPYFWNSAIPHERLSHVHRLMFQDALDPTPKSKICTFSSGEVPLLWRRARSEDFLALLDRARSAGTPALQVRRMEGVWMISIPTLAYTDEAGVGRIRAVLAEMSARASELRRSTLVFDVRGNHGGDSAWGGELARALWGEAWVEWVSDSLDTTVDWRASPSNLEVVEWMLEREQRAGLARSVEHLGRIRDAIKAALESGRPLARVDDPVERPRAAPPDSPISGRVYLLTDGACASACLDLADLMRRLPGVKHVGLPTSADAVYIDNTYAELPSGLAGLGYSMKVYRNRVRKNNEWYEPEIRWPGGEMTDEAVVRWIAALP
jgi:hypothetical protein